MSEFHSHGCEVYFYCTSSWTDTAHYASYASAKENFDKWKNLSHVKELKLIETLVHTQTFKKTTNILEEWKQI